MGIRLYKQGDEQQIQQLFEKVFKKQRSIAHWKWKFEGTPSLILVFEEKNEILGHISLWLFEGYIGGEEKKLGVRVDTMVDPDARGKGIYKQLNEAMIEHANEAGISILHGFPAEKAKALLQKYTDGKHIADISRFYIVLKPWKIAASIHKIAKPLQFFDGLYQAKKLRKVRPNFPEGIKVEAVQHCDERFDELAEKTKNLKKVMVKRDAAYLNWRYFNHPDNEYSMFAINKNGMLQGYVVIKKETMQKKNGELTLGFIVDWLAIDDRTNWEYLMQTALTYLEDTDLIQTWSFTDNQFVPAMLSFGLKERDRPMPFVVHDLADNPGTLDVDNWWLTQGDIDSF
ncbi:GNAT family N-acetyltransferase [Aquibacillus albus]|uniref:GNAT superfamily N-acetyltransferase n=1 Tax=Aquibacillus albus TaxID=1168171 RepID=A0ABS2MZW8_9BACI|nr:GNAT family N-acetyltransferase [Aquibacillus albus]MBM7571338.1 GNAT superfamily N-acetyltransferase [Aquibacillus albus]